MAEAADRPTYWILDAGGNPVPAPDERTWCEWMAGAEMNRTRLVAETIHADGVVVVTNFCSVVDACEESPLLWETRIVGGPHDGERFRYRTREEAAEGHERAGKLALEREDAGLR